MRLDKWLWAARLFKTRALAVEAISGGRVEVDGARAKPSREVKVGDQLTISHGQGIQRVVIVRGLAERRGPAQEAQQLYDETPESVQERERVVAERRLAQPPRFDLGGRPTKRDRRRLDTRRGR
jgi:ribosome-associated heat shock protein Hsp15